MKKKYLGIDLLRSFCILMIVFYHSWETLYGSETISFTPSQSLYGLLDQFLSRNFGYAGLGIVFISFFLAGFGKHESRLDRWIILIGGVFALNMSTDLSLSLIERVSWSVYCFLLLSFCTVVFYSRFKWSPYFIATFSLLILTTDHDFWTAHIHTSDPDLIYIYFGGPDTEFIGWGLLPWISLPLFGWSLGRLTEKYQSFLKKVSKVEAALLITITMFVIYNWPSQDGIPISRSGFYAYVFKNPAIYFWSRFSIFLILFRLSFWDLFELFVNSYRWTKSIGRFIGSLCWNRYFGFSYFFHFVVIQIGIPWREFLFDNPRWLDWYWVLVIVLTELWMQVFTRFFKWIRSILPVRIR